MASDRGEALGMGDVVNTASRLQSAAPTGRVVVGRETHRATRHAIRYKSSPAIDAKGKAEPVEAWLAVEPSTAPAERPLASTALVGRARELELMASVWTRALSERRPHMFTVIGPPGIGKTRLCREVASTVAGRKSPARTMSPLRRASRLPGVLVPRARCVWDRRVGSARGCSREARPNRARRPHQGRGAGDSSLPSAPARPGSARRSR